MEWFALLIPLFCLGVVYLVFKNTFTWWEYSIPVLSSIIIILLTKLLISVGKTTDTEYWGSLVVEARYYEYWESYVHKTCSYTTTCCCDSKGNGCQTTTHYYDCSYCDHNNAYWMAYDDAGNEWRISQEYYNYLKQKWKSVPQFVELNRDIDYHSGCGQDGNMYRIVWNKKIESSEGSVTKHDYKNRIQSAKSSFKFENISKKQARKLGLYDYPKFYNYYKQKVILGLDSINVNNKELIETYYQYFNGYRGARNQVKVFVCLFFDKPLSIVRKQQAYWDGGNQNELTICISLDKNQNIQWVEAFSFTNNKRVLVDLREDISNLETFKPFEIYKVIDHAVGKNKMYRDFDHDFDYLKVELSKGNIVWIYIITFIVSIISCWFCISNPFGKVYIENYDDIKYYLKCFWNKIK